LLVDEGHPAIRPPAVSGHEVQAGVGIVNDARQRYGLLLLALAVTLAFEGIAAPGDLQRAIGALLVGADLLLAFFAADMPVRRFRIAALLVAAIVAGLVLAAIRGNTHTVFGLAAIVNGMMIALAPPAVVIGIYRNLRDTRTVTLTVVAGVLCLYLLVGLFFASVYVAVQNLGGAPFFANGAAATSTRAVYFSFITLATVGYGDFTARTSFGHTLAISEALVGQIYLVTIVASIISRLAPRGRQAA
jgi:hypothetical protein